MVTQAYSFDVPSGACVTHTHTLVTSDLNLEPEVAWGKVVSWIGTDSLSWLEAGHLLPLMIHKELCLCLLHLSSSSSSSQQKHPLFFHAAFFLIYFQKRLNDWLSAFFSSPSSLCLHMSPIFFSFRTLVWMVMMTVMAPFWLKGKVKPSVGHFFYDAPIKVCHQVTLKPINYIEI